MAHLHTENGITIVRDDWDADDIRSVVENMSTGDGEMLEPLTDKQTLLVMNLMTKRDAAMGINWGFIQVCVEEVLSWPASAVEVAHAKIDLTGHKS